MAVEKRERADPLGRAMYDYERDRMGTLRYRDGAAVRDGHVEAYYFQPPEAWADETIALLERLAALDGPVVDVGCGAGQHALWLQERGVDVVGTDASPHAVAAARSRGVRDARVDDMFDMAFESGRFRGLHAVGTQIGLAGSLAGVSALLGEFARVTDDEGVAVVHNYDPNEIDEDLFGYRPDPREGVARRRFHFEYVPEADDDLDDSRGSGRDAADRGADSDRDAADRGADSGHESDRDTAGRGSDPDRSPRREVGPTLDFLLFDPDRLADATIGTPWTIADVLETEITYKAVLRKDG